MGTVIAFPIGENEHVQDYLKSLKVNKRSTSDFMALLNAVDNLEKMLVQSDKNMAEMQKQLSELREIQKHPVKTELSNISSAIKEAAGLAKSWLVDLKEKIVNFCKKVLENFKYAGVSTLDKTASFLKLKDGFEAISNYATKNNELCGKAIRKIENFSAEYHKAGRSIKNMGRVMLGKEPVDTVKENGKLAKAIAAPYHSEKALWAKIEQKAYVTARALRDFHTRTKIKGFDRQEAKEAKKAEQAEKSQKIDILRAVEKHKESVATSKKDNTHENKKSKEER